MIQFPAALLPEVIPAGQQALHLPSQIFSLATGDKAWLSILAEITVDWAKGNSHAIVEDEQQVPDFWDSVDWSWL